VLFFFTCRKNMVKEGSFFFLLYSYPSVLFILSRVIHLDVILTFFFTLAILAFYLCEKKNDIRYTFLVGISFGLAYLTKSTALLLLPILFL